MMMSYHLRDNRRKKTRWFFVILLIVFLFFYSNITNFFQGVFQLAIYPIWVTENYVEENTINPFNFLSSKKKLIVENERLERELNEAEITLSDRGLVVKENIELKEIMGRRYDIKNLLLASVVAKPPISLYDSLIIDAGENLDVKKGSKVFVLGNILIGTIDNVNKTTSKVKLFSSSQEENNVMVGLYNINAVALGKGGGNFEIKLPRNTNVEIDDIVVSSGSNSTILGSVEEIISNPIDPFKTLLFKSPVNMFELKWVQIESNI